LCNPLFGESKANLFLKPFKIKVFFKLSEKQSVVLLKQPIVLLLGVFEKLKTVLVGSLAVKPKQSIVS